MKTLKVVLLVAAVLFGLGALGTAAAGLWIPALYLLVSATVLVIGALFERGRYRPEVSAGGDWEMTDEKFRDDATGKWMQVRYNKRTGERDYVEMPTGPR